MLNEHLMTTVVCLVDLSNAPQEREGIVPELRERLQSRKKTHPSQTPEDKWKEIYRLLFPTDEVPSPCK